MDDTKPAGKPPTRQSSRGNHLVTAVILYNVVLTVVMLLGALHFNSRVRSVEVLLQKEHLQNFDKPVDSTDIEGGEDVVKSPRNATAMNKREVLSVNNLESQLREGLGAFSGAVYVRWGRKDCPDQSKLIYHGLAAGSDFRSPAGGSNLQCLPSDPQYDPKYSDIKVLHSFLSKVIWEGEGYSHFNNLLRRQMPCAVCESNQRATKLIIPAATQCPSADWHLEYKGFLVSDYNMHASGAIHTDGNRHSRSTYECLDEYPVSFKPDEGQGGAAGTLMRLIKVSCSGDTSINYCPPYKEDQPISCVLCTK